MSGALPWVINALELVKDQVAVRTCHQRAVPADRSDAIVLAHCRVGGGAWKFERREGKAGWLNLGLVVGDLTAFSKCCRDESRLGYFMGATKELTR